MFWLLALFLFVVYSIAIFILGMFSLTCLFFYLQPKEDRSLFIDVITDDFVYKFYPLISWYKDTKKLWHSMFYGEAPTLQEKELVNNFLKKESEQDFNERSIELCNG